MLSVISNCVKVKVLNISLQIPQTLVQDLCVEVCFSYQASARCIMKGKQHNREERMSKIKPESVTVQLVSAELMPGGAE